MGSHTTTHYWRSMEELADTPEFRQMVEKEFPARKGELVDPLSRRRFLQVMGASLAMAGLTGCEDVLRLRWPKDEILPFTSRPEGRTPGEPVYYATAIELGGVAQGLLVKSYDGRPIKVEGNAAHPGSLGATHAFAQASVLDLYDPDRLRRVWRGAGPEQEPSSWAAFLSDLNAPLAALRDEFQGEGVYVLAQASSSPTLRRLRHRLMGSDGPLPAARWLEYEPAGRENARAGAKAAFGDANPLRTRLDLTKADVVVSLDADLLHLHPDATRHARDFMDRRRPDPDAAPAQLEMSRLFVAESTLTITGTTADHRLALPPTRVALVGIALAGRVAADERVKGDARTRDRLVKAGEDAEAALRSDLTGDEGEPDREELREQIEDFLAAAAADLVRARKRGVVAVGERQPPELHHLGHLLNNWLGNDLEGGPVVHLPEAGDDLDRGRPSHAEAVRELARAEPRLVIVLGGNPVHDAPADVDLAEALGKAERSVYLGHDRNETARACRWVLPAAHYLESWGDARAWDGTKSIVQPLIQPIFKGRSAPELLGLLLALLGASGSSKGYELVRETFFAEDVPASAPKAERERAWRETLHDGVVAESAFPPERPAVALDVALDAVTARAARRPAPDSLELVLTPDPSVYDGRFANNGWLQELPDPVTKLTWDNALLMSPETAVDLDLVSPKEKVALLRENVVELRVGDGEAQEVAAFLLPGMPRHVVALSLGYGRGASAGVVAGGTGFDAYPLRTAGAPWVRTGATVKATGGVYELATTQDHHAIMTALGAEEASERGSGQLVQEATLADYKRDPRFAHTTMGPPPRKVQMWPSPIDFSEASYRWGMTIDLNACTGCSACVVACVAENNIPVVGKQEVMRGREMHWLRIDRYFSRDTRLRSARRDAEAAPLKVVHQPVPCMQCENAPCESVCPVAATVHSEDGLNDMVYNRCIGTRYCSNNCPYKVRRFNYFWNHYGPFHPRSEPGASTLPAPPETTPLYSDVAKMVYNPDVTVRARGVMEKCTYCVQRIKAKTIPARNRKERVDGDAIQTACQQACPTDAIAFGDLHQRGAKVSKLHSDARSYQLLDAINTRARTRYLAKLRNPAQAQAE